MRHALGVLLAATGLALAAVNATAAEPKVLLMDTVETVLKAHKDKRVTVRMRSGGEISGTVVVVTARLVHVSAIAGRELFDAVVPLEAIEAVLVRTKD